MAVKDTLKIAELAYNSHSHRSILGYRLVNNRRKCKKENENLLSSNIEKPVKNFCSFVFFKNLFKTIKFFSVRLII